MIFERIPSLHLKPFLPIVPFYTPWKDEKTFGFLIFSEGIKIEHWAKMGDRREDHYETKAIYRLRCATLLGIQVGKVNNHSKAVAIGKL